LDWNRKTLGNKKILFNCQDNEMILIDIALFIDIKSFIQMIYILFGLSNILRVEYILFELSLDKTIR